MPDSIHNAAEASRHVGEVELTPSPTAAANVTRTRESAVAPSAPAITGVHCRYRGSASAASGSITAFSKVICGDLTGARRMTAPPTRQRPDQPDKSNHSWNAPSVVPATVIIAWSPEGSIRHQFVLPN